PGAEEKDRLVGPEDERLGEQGRSPRRLALLEHLPAGLVQFRGRALGVQRREIQESETDDRPEPGNAHAARRSDFRANDGARNDTSRRTAGSEKITNLVA